MIKRFLAPALLGVLALLSVAARADSKTNATYTMDNSAAGNRVLVFSRDNWGTLHSAGSYPTGGQGTGAGLGSQGALTMSNDNKWLLAVNAGSSELSVFAVRGGDLVLTDVVPSGGKRPISVTMDNNLVYALNAGGAVGASDNLCGFYLSKEGRLLAIPGLPRALSAPSTTPAQVSFSPTGDHLVVTEKGTNLVDTFVVDNNGSAGLPHFLASSGATPFGFAFTPSGALVVSEAVGGAPGASTLSSYAVRANGILNTFTASLHTTQTAACWVATARNGRYAYVANTGSNTVTGVRVANNGAITLLKPSGVSAPSGVTPIDVAVSDNDRFLYVLTAGDGSISQYRIEADGDLVPLGAISGLPVGTVGLVAR